MDNRSHIAHNVLASCDFNATASQGSFASAFARLLIIKPISPSSLCASFKPSCDQGRTVSGDGPSALSRASCWALNSAGERDRDVILRILAHTTASTGGSHIGGLSSVSPSLELSEERISSLWTSATTTIALGIFDPLLYHL